jgi:DNA polymerase delta subunit 2
MARRGATFTSHPASQTLTRLFIRLLLAATLCSCPARPTQARCFSLRSVYFAPTSCVTSLTLLICQAPFHHCFVSTASSFSSAVAVSNPCELSIGDFTMIATGAPHVASFTVPALCTSLTCPAAGQSVLDLMRYCSLGSSCDAMQAQLEWRHLAPTAPDTIACYPFVDSDPFLLDGQAPHLYVAGNQPAFEQRTLGGVQIIAVPEFSSTGEVIIFDPATGTARSMLFRAEK